MHSITTAALSGVLSLPTLSYTARYSVEMLAVYPSMDALHRSNSFHAVNSKTALTREPSAEDLDAAHQLVSSARGERASSYSTLESEKRHEVVSRIPDDARSQASTNTNTTSDHPATSAEDQQPNPIPSTEVDTANVGGQVCRYVLP